jgi:hypothetical protein
MSAYIYSEYYIVKQIYALYFEPASWEELLTLFLECS